MAETKETKTYTQEEVDKNYVKKADYDSLYAEYKKLAAGFNTLLKEFNELHVAHLLATKE